MCFLRFFFIVCYFIFASCYAAASGEKKMNNIIQCIPRMPVNAMQVIMREILRKVLKTSIVESVTLNTVSCRVLLTKM